MSELVLLHHNEPMTTSETLAEGVMLQHKNVVSLIRKHIADLSEWGEIAFQTRFNPQGKPTEFAWLSEGQSLFLLTLMKNSPVVVAFKKALVKAFLELRAAVSPAPTFSAVDHRADVLVSADRTFRAILRSCRAAGARLPAALARANEVTVRETGVDMLAEIGPVERPVAALTDPIADGIAVWAEKAGDGPWSLAEILRQAFGLEPEARDYGRITVLAGPALRAAGFERRKRRIDGPLRNWWMRKEVV